MSAKDKQRLGIAVGLVVIVTAALYLLVFRGKPEEQTEVAARPAAGEEAADRSERPGAGGRPSGVAARGAVPAGDADAQEPGAPVEPKVTPDPYRVDPFQRLIEPPPPPRQPPPPPPPAAVVQVGIPPVMMGALPEVLIAREGPYRRTAGVLWNNQVWAIIETEKTTAVVQPGDVVEGNTVRAISPQGLILAIQGGEEVDVELAGRGAASRPRAAPAGMSTPPGRPSLPGAPTPGASSVSQVPSPRFDRTRAET